MQSQYASLPHPPPPPHLIEDLQVEGVDAGRHRALDHLVPARVLRSVVSGWRLIDRVAQTDPTVWVHPRHAIVFGQFGLEKHRVPSQCSHSQIVFQDLHSCYSLT